jgi:hypothetical protein
MFQDHQIETGFITNLQSHAHKLLGQGQAFFLLNNFLGGLMERSLGAPHPINRKVVGKMMLAHSAVPPYQPPPALQADALAGQAIGYFVDMHHAAIGRPCKSHGFRFVWHDQNSVLMKRQSPIWTAACSKKRPKPSSNPLRRLPRSLN